MSVSATVDFSDSAMPSGPKAGYKRTMAQVDDLGDTIKQQAANIPAQGSPEEEAKRRNVIMAVIDAILNFIKMMFQSAMTYSQRIWAAGPKSEQGRPANDLGRDAGGAAPTKSPVDRNTLQGLKASDN